MLARCWSNVEDVGPTFNTRGHMFCFGRLVHVRAERDIFISCKYITTIKCNKVLGLYIPIPNNMYDTSLACMVKIKYFYVHSVMIWKTKFMALLVCIHAI